MAAGRRCNFLIIQWLFIQGLYFMSYGLKSPKIKPFHFSGELGEGLRTVVMCAVVDGDPPFEFQWSKDGRILNSDHKDISIGKFDEFTSILNIEKLDADSNGNYTCRVSNAQGYDHKSDALSMRGNYYL
ncbi:hypothetical protein JTE90_026182 [Oedothorax gibbosus]|uniref:Ig-like domain-containing protein n=1 Tax=Oedothorax gibbosus TaxID=931172 RepID=A0AAV6UHH7_9ARAC|nr:hypothetical protein JTE90_026182 [Oedothorax gibbosus]